MTSALLPEALGPLRADPGRSAILFDIDGTLAPIVQNAADAHVPEGTRQLLIRVARRYGLVACVSGRQASDARAMVAIGTIAYLGSHGAEVLRPGWTEAKLDEGLEDWARRVHDFSREADTAEVRRLRGQVAALEAELAELRASVSVTDDDLRLLTLDERVDEPAFS